MDAYDKTEDAAIGDAALAQHAIDTLSPNTGLRQVDQVDGICGVFFLCGHGSSFHKRRQSSREEGGMVFMIWTLLRPNRGVINPSFKLMSALMAVQVKLS